MSLLSRRLLVRLDCALHFEARAIFAARVDAMVARTGADAFARPPPPPRWEETMCGRGAALLRRFREVALAASAPPPPPKWGAGAAAATR